MARPNRNQGCKSTDTLTYRFERWVEKTPSCWVWIGSFGGKGYGQLTFKRQRLYAHRVSYELAHGAIPNVFMVCHRCDNPKCVNPDHLFLGTQKDNMHDCSVKGRNKRGEAISWSKLTEKEVIKMREIYTEGKISYLNLAKKFGFNVVTAFNAVKGKTWSHI